jgi:hypothetical protein
MCAVMCAVASIMTSMRKGLIRCARRVMGHCDRGHQMDSMTISTDLLTQLRREWRRTGRTVAARAALERMHVRHPQLGLDGVVDLCGLVDALESHGGRSVLERAAIIRVLLEEASDPQLHRALLQTMIPGIVSTCRQLRFGEGIVRDPSETVAAAMALASELLVDWAGQSRQYAAPDILSAVRGRLRRWLLKEKRALRSIAPYAPDDEPAQTSSPLESRIASYRGSQYDRLARLTYARVFEGRSLRDLARDDHSAPNSLQAELQIFAIRFLI